MFFRGYFMSALVTSYPKVGNEHFVYLRWIIKNSLFLLIHMSYWKPYPDTASVTPTT